MRVWQQTAPRETAAAGLAAQQAPLMPAAAGAVVAAGPAGLSAVAAQRWAEHTFCLAACMPRAHTNTPLAWEVAQYSAYASCIGFINRSLT